MGEVSPPRNRRAVTALKRAWVPGVGLVMGRKALREIQETGEGGRSRALWAMGVNGVVTGALIAGIVSSWISGGPSAGDDLMAYQAGQCFDVPGLADAPQLADDFVAPVKKQDCSGPHEAEVVGRWASGRSYDAYPGRDAMGERALDECARRLTDYASDTWRWPDTLRLGAVGLDQGSQMFGRSSHVVCYVTGAAGRSVMQDPSARTPVQSAYLKAVDAYVVAAARKPDTKGAVADFDGWRTYAASMATASLRESEALRTGRWPAAAAQPLAELEALDQREAAHWRKAATAPGAGEVDREIAAAQAEDGYGDATAALRRVLGLPADGVRGHEVPV